MICVECKRDIITNKIVWCDRCYEREYNYHISMAKQIKEEKEYFKEKGYSYIQDFVLR